MGYGGLPLIRVAKTALPRQISDTLPCVESLIVAKLWVLVPCCFVGRHMHATFAAPCTTRT